MKIIDLLNKIANGEEVPKKIRIDHWCYKFEWIEHQSNYYDRNNEIDLMSCLSCDKEELNYEIHKIEEEKKIPEKLNWKPKESMAGQLTQKEQIEVIARRTEKLKKEFNNLLDYLKSKGE